ncbi:MAG: hypothetical protein AAF152_13685 [Cyanobacteria bacterium P01_A01_bin.114]
MNSTAPFYTAPFYTTVRYSFWVAVAVNGVMTFAIAPLLPAAAQAAIDYSLLVGEWAAPDGGCDTLRRVFAGDGSYTLLENEDGTWTSVYDGIYLTSDAETPADESIAYPGFIQIGEDRYADAFSFGIQTLTANTLRLDWIGYSDSPELDEPSTYNLERCPSR